MKRNFSLIIIAILFSMGCANPAQNEKANQGLVNESIASKVTLNPEEEKIAKAGAIKQLDALEKLFDNSNYLIVEGKDSGYLYFSRRSSNLIQVHHYKMLKGDSAGLKIDSIQFNAQFQIEWNNTDLKLVLENCTANTSLWRTSASDSNKCLFQKSGGNAIVYTKPIGQKITLQKTIALSSFFIRSLYDYRHGTTLAFDTTNFTKKHPM